MTVLNLSPWLTIPAMLGGMLLLLTTLRAWQVASHPHPELVRKLFHLGGGLLALPLPWLFSSYLPVMVLGLASIALFTLLRIMPSLQAGIGQVLSSVHRNTVGEYCFILSLFLLFFLAHDTPILYGIPLLILVIADTFAALVGKEYGKKFYSANGDSKSAEGSFSFFMAAFFCVHVPVLIFTNTPRLESLLIGVNIALMVMMSEAAAWWGLDNLIIPLFSYVLLKSFLDLDAAELTHHLSVLIGLSIFIHYVRKRTALADDALFGAALWGYVSWDLAGWHWVIPSVILMIMYTNVTRHAPANPDPQFHFTVVLANIFGSIFWLMLFWYSHEPKLFTPFVSIYGADLSIIALIRHRNAQPQASLFRSVMWGSNNGILLLIPSILLFHELTATGLKSLAAAALAVITATVLFAIIQPNLDLLPVSKGRWLRQTMITALCSLLAFGLIIL